LLDSLLQEMETKEDVSMLEKKLMEAEQRAKDAEDNMRQAAMYGKVLLEKNMELETQFEGLQQEKYETNLRLQAKLTAEQNLLSELESLRDVVKQLEQEKENVVVEGEEKLAQREEIWKARMAELDTALQASETKEKGLVQRLEIAENQLQEALNQSVGGQSFSVELSDLQFQFTELLKEKQTMESEVGRLNAELDEEKAKMNNAAAKIDLVNKEMEEIQCQMSGYVRAAEASKEEALEMEAQLEAIKAGQLNQDGKGNSLFSEVNDRREKVEDQLKVFEEKYNTLKENYTLKCDQLQKTKMHNAQLLSIAGTRNDSNHTGRLEELLEAERNKNKTLSSRLDLLEKLGSESEPIRNVDPFVGAKNQESEGHDNSSVQHTATEEYNYLTTMLNESKQKKMQLCRKKYSFNVDKILKIVRSSGT